MDFDLIFHRLLFIFHGNKLAFNLMKSLLPVTTKADIPKHFQNTPIELLLQYHNLGKPHEAYSNANLLVGMCMDSRKNLLIPDNFAFILRAGGANLRYSEFKVSYAIGVGGIRCLALIGHNQCGMVNLVERKNQFIEGLTENAGWNREEAEEHFYRFAPMFEIGDETAFVLSETKRLRLRYPNITVAPLIYRVEDNLLYLIDES